MDSVPTRLPVKRRGWIAPLMLGVKRELNTREKTQYEKYQDYCRRVIHAGYSGAPDHIWYVVNQSLPSV